MSVVAALFVLAGSALALLAGVGLLKFSTPYARLHAAGKASPIAFLLIGIGASYELGAQGALLFIVAAAALVLTLPVGVHLLFRALHRTGGGGIVARDDLRLDDALTSPDEATEAGDDISS